VSYYERPKMQTPPADKRYQTICKHCDQLVVVAYFGYPPDYRLLQHMLPGDGYCVGSKECIKSEAED
jgi:hypothetical protein